MQTSIRLYYTFTTFIMVKSASLASTQCKVNKYLPKTARFRDKICIFVTEIR